MKLLIYRALPYSCFGESPDVCWQSPLLNGVVLCIIKVNLKRFLYPECYTGGVISLYFSVSSVQTTVPLKDQAEDSNICGFTMVQNLETLGSDTTPSRNSDAESDVTVDYIEPNSSPGHWFLSATQDFTGSTFS